VFSVNTGGDLMKNRRYDIDWLRVFAMLCVFLFHCTRFFDQETWHVKAPLAQQSEILPTIRGMLVWVWLMEMFFLVSGFATRYALKRRSAGQYLAERAKRLLIPLYTVGLLLLVPPQFYLELFSQGRITSTFLEWLPTFYRSLPEVIFSIPRGQSPLGLTPYPFYGHLWFLQILFLISLLTLPILFFLRSEKGERLIGKLVTWSEHPGGIFIFVLPLVLVRAGLMWMPSYTDESWANFLWYTFFFLYGFILASDERFIVAVNKNRWIGLALWFGLFVGVGSIFLFVLGFEPDEGLGFSGLFVIWEICYSLISWGAIIFLLSLFNRKLNFSNSLLSYSNEAVLPFYLLHQTVILIVGWYVIPLINNSLISYLAIVLISFPFILLLYEVFIRHIPFMRFLFGMTPKKKQSVDVERLKLA
jgi:glucan biosynthesis protein C